MNEKEKENFILKNSVKYELKVTNIIINNDLFKYNKMNIYNSLPNLLYSILINEYNKINDNNIFLSLLILSYSNLTK